jgi:predicted dehydrogenase
MLRLGIAGCGWAGERHHDAAVAHGRAEVVAIADADTDTLERRASEWEIDATFEDYADMYENADLDAVVVALPHDLHEDAVVRAARAGLPVLCEKPIARTVAEADRMLNAAEDHEIPLVVAESARDGPWVSEVENVLTGNIVSQPVVASFN